jgi:predicted transcriptional regulator
MFKSVFSRLYSGGEELEIADRVRYAHRRWGIDIIACILRASHNGIRKTDLMIQCNLSFAQLRNYLNVVLKKELIVVEKNGVHLVFKISNKGKTFLESYENLAVLIK